MYRKIDEFIKDRNQYRTLTNLMLRQGGHLDPDHEKRFTELHGSFRGMDVEGILLKEIENLKIDNESIRRKYERLRHEKKTN